MFWVDSNKGAWILLISATSHAKLRGAVLKMPFCKEWVMNEKFNSNFLVVVVVESSSNTCWCNAVKIVCWYDPKHLGECSIITVYIIFTLRSVPTTAEPRTGDIFSILRPLLFHVSGNSLIRRDDLILFLFIRHNTVSCGCIHVNICSLTIFVASIR